MKKFRRFLISFLVICLFVAVAIFGSFFKVGATNEVKTTIAGHNLAFQEKVYLTYYVNNKYVPDGAEKGLLIWKSVPTKYYYKTADYTLTADHDEYISYKLYDTYYFDQLSSTEFTKDIYAMSYIKYEEDGEVIYVYSELDKYSILQYAYNKLNSTAPADQAMKEILTDMLNYGADSQQYFKENLEKLATDTYHEVHLYNAVLSDGTSYGLYKEGSVINVTANVPNGVNYQWLDEDGNATANQNITVNEDVTIYADYINANLTYADVTDPDGGAAAYAVSAYNGTGADVYIPAFYNGKKVIKINDSVFAGKTNVVNVYGDINVKYIGTSAFAGATNLAKYNFAKGLKEIGEAAFANTALSEATMPSTVKTIKANAFANTNITTLTIPDGVTTLEAIANGGDYNSNVKTLVLGKGVTAFNDTDNFKGMSQLQKIYYKGTETAWADVYAALNADDQAIVDAVEDASNLRFYSSCIHEVGNKWTYDLNGEISIAVSTHDKYEFGHCRLCDYAYTFTVSYASNLGYDYTLVNNVSQYQYGNKVDPGRAVRDGYYFDGWYLDSNLTNKFEYITPTTFGDITLYPKFIEGSSCLVYSDNQDGTLNVTDFDYSKPHEVIYVPDMYNGKLVTTMNCKNSSNLAGDDRAIREIYLCDSIIECTEQFMYCRNLAVMKYSNSQTSISQFCGSTVVLIIGKNATSMGSVYDNIYPVEVYNLSNMDISKGIGKEAQYIHTSILEDTHYFYAANSFFDVSDDYNIVLYKYCGYQNIMTLPSLDGTIYEGQKYIIPTDFMKTDYYCERLITNGNVKKIQTGAFNNATKLQFLQLDNNVKSIENNAFISCPLHQSNSYICIPVGFKNFGNLFNDNSVIYFEGTEAQLSAMSGISSTNVSKAKFYVDCVHESNEWTYVNGYPSTAVTHQLVWEKVGEFDYCTEDGVYRAYCEANDKYYEKAHVHPGHDYVDGVCTRCGDEKVYYVRYYDYLPETLLKTDTFTVSSSYLTLSGCDTYNNKTLLGYFLKRIDADKYSGYITGIDPSDKANLHDWTIYIYNISNTVPSTTQTYVSLGNNETRLQSCAMNDIYLHKIVVPDYYNGNKVVEIVKASNSTKVFYPSATITSIYLPKALRVIGEYSFKDLPDVTSVILPKAITTIGDNAFDGCTNLVIYYEGTEADWENVNISDSYRATLASQVKFLEKEVHADNEWVYDTYGKPNTTICDHELEYSEYDCGVDTCLNAHNVRAWCNINNKWYYQEVAALGHTYENGVCIRCGAQEVLDYQLNLTYYQQDGTSNKYYNYKYNNYTDTFIFTLTNNNNVPLEVTFTVHNPNNDNGRINSGTIKKGTTVVQTFITNTRYTTPTQFVKLLYPGESLELYSKDSTSAYGLKAICITLNSVCRPAKYNDYAKFSVIGDYLVKTENGERTLYKYLGSSIPSSLPTTYTKQDSSTGYYKYDSEVLNTTNGYNASVWTSMNSIIVPADSDASIIGVLANFNNLDKIYFAGSTMDEWHAIDANHDFDDKVYLYSPHVHEEKHWNYVSGTPSIAETTGCFNWVLDYDCNCNYDGQNKTYCSANEKWYYQTIAKDPDKHTYNDTDTCSVCGLNHPAVYAINSSNLNNNGNNYSNQALASGQSISFVLTSNDTLPIRMSIDTVLSGVTVNVKYISVVPGVPNSATSFNNIGNGQNISFEIMPNDMVEITFTATSNVAAGAIQLNNLSVKRISNCINPTVYEKFGDFIFNIIDDKLVLTKYVGKASAIELPTIGKPYYLADDLFENYNGGMRHSITSVKFSADVIATGTNTFKNSDINYLIVNDEIVTFKATSITGCDDLQYIYFEGTPSQWVAAYGSYENYDKVYYYNSCAHDEREWRYDNGNPTFTPLHDDLAWVTVSESTCSTRGYQTATCSTCGETVVKRLPIVAGAHKYEASTGKCSECGKTADYSNINIDIDTNTVTSNSGSYHFEHAAGNHAVDPLLIFSITNNCDFDVNVKFDLENVTNANASQSIQPPVLYRIVKKINGETTTTDTSTKKYGVNDVLGESDYIRIYFIYANDVTAVANITAPTYSIPDETITTGTFEYGGFLFQYENSTLNCIKYIGTDTVVKFPNYKNINYNIGSNVFKNYKGVGSERMITEIITDSHTIKMDKDAFAGCINVHTIEINQFNYTIYKDTLTDLTSLQHIYFGGKTKEVWTNVLDVNDVNEYNYTDIVKCYVTEVHDDTEWTYINGVRSFDICDHDLEWKTITYPTCTAVGREQAYCETNEKWYYRDIAYSHNYDSNGVCQTCGCSFNPVYEITTNGLAATGTANDYTINTKYQTSMSNPLVLSTFMGDLVANSSPAKYFNARVYVTFTITNYNASTSYVLTIQDSNGKTKFTRRIYNETFTYGMYMAPGYTYSIGVPSGTANNTSYHIDFDIVSTAIDSANNTTYSIVGDYVEMLSYQDRTLIGYVGSDTVITLPGRDYAGHTDYCYTIGNNLFKGYHGKGTEKNITDITFSKYIVGFSENAFVGLSGVKSIQVPESFVWLNSNPLTANHLSQFTGLTAIYFEGQNAGEWHDLINVDSDSHDNIVRYNLQHVHDTSSEWKLNNDGTRCTTVCDDDLSWSEVTASTCHSYGTKTATCSVNNKTYTASIPLLPHTYNHDSSNAANDGVCSVCGAHQYSISATGFDASFDNFSLSKSVNGYENNESRSSVSFSIKNTSSETFTFEYSVTCYNYNKNVTGTFSYIIDTNIGFDDYLTLTNGAQQSTTSRSISLAPNRELTIIVYIDPNTLGPISVGVEEVTILIIPK